MSPEHGGDMLPALFLKEAVYWQVPNDHPFLAIPLKNV